MRRARRAARRLRARRSGTRCRPTCRRSARRSRMCSGPSVVDDRPCRTRRTFPSDRRPMRRSKSSMRSAGKPSGNVGNGRSRTSPAISQCPVTESLPGDASAMRPNAPTGSGVGSADVDQTRQPERTQRRHAQAGGAGDVAEGVAALVAVRRRIRQLADADRVHDDENDTGEGRHREVQGGAARGSRRPAVSPAASSQRTPASLRNQIAWRRA